MSVNLFVCVCVCVCLCLCMCICVCLCSPMNVFIILFYHNRDPGKTPRSVSCICWSPDGGNKLAGAYSILDFQKTDGSVKLDSLIWDIGEYQTNMLKKMCVCVRARVHECVRVTSSPSATHAHDN